MDGVGDYVLADTGLSGQENRAFRRRHLPDFVHHFPETEVGAHNRVAREMQ